MDLEDNKIIIRTISLYHVSSTIPNWYLIKPLKMIIQNIGFSKETQLKFGSFLKKMNVTFAKNTSIQ